MKIVFLRDAEDSLRWFHHYYTVNFPEGASKAEIQFENTLQTLSDYPFSGRKIEGRETRVYAIPKTPFSVVYQVLDDRIEVFTLFDQRKDPFKFDKL